MDEILKRLDRLDSAVLLLNAAAMQHSAGDVMIGELLKGLSELLQGLNLRVAAIEHGVLANDFRANKN